MKLNTWLINGSILTLGIMLTACVDMPGSKSDQAKVLALPKRYDATQPPVPEVTSGLLKVFPDTQLRKYVDIALNKNPDLRASAARLEELVLIPVEHIQQRCLHLRPMDQGLAQELQVHLTA